METTPLLVVCFLASSFVCGFFCMHVAEQKNYNGALWLLAGWAFSLMALIAIAGMPVKPVQAVLVRNPQDVWVCPKCDQRNWMDQKHCYKCKTPREPQCAPVTLG